MIATTTRENHRDQSFDIGISAKLSSSFQEALVTIEAMRSIKLLVAFNLVPLGWSFSDPFI